MKQIFIIYMLLIFSACQTSKEESVLLSEADFFSSLELSDWEGTYEFKEYSEGQIIDLGVIEIEASILDNDITLEKKQGIGSFYYTLHLLGDGNEVLLVRYSIQLGFVRYGERYFLEIIESNTNQQHWQGNRIEYKNGEPWNGYTIDINLSR